MHQDVDYLLSLGPDDAVGCIGNKNTIISGLPAFLAKEAIKVQYDWLLSGIDTYVVWFSLAKLFNVIIVVSY